MAELAKFFVTLGSKFDAAGLKKANTGFGKFKNSMLKIGKSLAIVGAAGIAMGAVLVAGALKAAKAAGVQEKAERLLAEALGRTKNAAGVTIDELKEYASGLQRVTTIGDETILGVMQMGLSMGVNADQIKGATKEAIGLSKAYKVDLNASMKMVALARAGEFSMLARYIPQLRTTTDKTEQLAIFNKAMADGFKIAEAETETYAGMIEQLKNDYGDLVEKIGFKVIPILMKLGNFIRTDVLPLLEKWLNLIKIDTKEIKEQSSEIIMLNKQIEWANKEKQKFLDKAAEGIRLSASERKAVENLKKLIIGYREEIEKLNKTKKESGEITKDVTAEGAKNWKQLSVSMSKNMTTGFAAIMQGTREMSEVWNIILDSMKVAFIERYAKRIVEEWIMKTEEMKVITEAMDTAFETMFTTLKSVVTDVFGSIAKVVIEKLGIVKAATLAWAGVEWAAHMAVVAAKIISGWATIPFVGWAIGVGVATAAIKEMAGKFKGFAEGAMTMGPQLAMFGEGKYPNEVALPLGHPKTTSALAEALDKAQAVSNTSFGGDTIHIHSTPSNRRHARELSNMLLEVRNKKISRARKYR